jgi:hypothetical protein
MCGMGQSMPVAHTNYLPIPIRMDDTKWCMVTPAGVK